MSTSPAPPRVTMGFSHETFPAGTHMCLIFSDDSYRRELMSKFVASGLAGGEKVVYLADRITPQEVREWLSEMGVELPGEGSEQLMIAPARELYCPPGEFVPERMLDALRTLYREAREAGYPASRISGEMSWARNGLPGCERLLEYEAMVNEVVVSHPLTAICQYDANQFDGATLLDVLRVHPMMIVRGQILRNPYYERPEDLLNRPPRDREERERAPPAEAGFEAQTSGKLLAASSVLRALPSEHRIGEFAARALRMVPSVTGSTICLRGFPQPLGDLSRACCRDCRVIAQPCGEGSSCDCGLSAEQGIRILPIESLNECHGIMALEGVALAEDGPMDPVIRNFCSAIATTIENNCQREKIERANRELQEEIRERRRAEARLHTALEEKEVLLREIHHRTKNNMAIIISLLRLQARKSQGQELLEVLQQSQNRIRAMALVHETLYRSPDLAQVDLREYLRGLTDSLYQAFGVSRARIELAIRSENVGLEIDDAIPVGLVINELVSNALKHAFPKRGQGKITIDVRHQEGGEIELIVRDDGQGMPAEDPHQHQTLGLALVHNLIVNQLGGTVRTVVDNGTCITITFKTRRQRHGETTTFS